jgi:hypothetical protein
VSDWIEHNGGPQPVDDDAWVEAQWPFAGGYLSGEPDEMEQASELPWEGWELRYRILNQHLIDAARLEGIRLGLEAADKAIEALYVECPATAWRNALEDASMDVRNLKPETIAREAQDMGSGKETT